MGRRGKYLELRRVETIRVDLSKKLVRYGMARVVLPRFVKQLLILPLPLPL